MKVERFQELAEAYGADLRRWPASDRAAAEALRLAEPVMSERLLFEAAKTDAVLHTSSTPQVSMALRDRVIASATAAGLSPQRVQRIARRLAWFSGAGWAAAACAGVVFGLNLTTQLTADQQVDAVLYQATLDGVDDTEVLG
ncbi:MAG: hypothetical protein DCE92_12415 [Alphaproteobacteria bacterium]|nr:MAG: hypothetical protein DCE92_12415 [Alphaproteobacteria bacterium]